MQRKYVWDVAVRSRAPGRELLTCNQVRVQATTAAAAKAEAERVSGLQGRESPVAYAAARVRRV